MSTSGSTDFGLFTNTLIDEAFGICGIGSEGEAISADMYARAKTALNLIVKHRAMKDHLWLRTAKSVTLIAGTASYVLTPKPLRVIEARRKVTASSIETPLQRWSQAEYLEQPNKAAQSIPVAWYYDPQRASGTLYVWPAPSTATAASTTLQLTYQRTIEDFDGTADDPDVPQEALRSLAYDLAEDLALKYGVRQDLRTEISGRAAMYRAEAEAWDTENASLYLQPDWRA